MRLLYVFPLRTTPGKTSTGTAMASMVELRTTVSSANSDVLNELTERAWTTGSGPPCAVSTRTICGPG